MDLTWVLFCISGSVLKCVLIVSMRDLCLDWVDRSDLGIGLHVWKCCKRYIKLWQHLFIIPRWPCVVVRMFKSNSQLPCLNRIADMPTPKDRMIQTVRWYLSAFHAGRPSEVAKKPYNPILGEHFLCYWTIPTAPECDVSGSGKDILHQDSATLFLSLFFSPALSSPLHPPHPPIPTPPSSCWYCLIPSPLSMHCCCGCLWHEWFKQTYSMPRWGKYFSLRWVLTQA